MSLTTFEEPTDFSYLKKGDKIAIHRADPWGCRYTIAVVERSNSRYITVNGLNYRPISGYQIKGRGSLHSLTPKVQTEIRRCRQASQLNRIEWSKMSAEDINHVWQALPQNRR